MVSINRKTSSSLSKSSWHQRIPWLLIPVLVLSFSIANAQQLTATLSGIATDQTDARIPGAAILVVSDTTGDKRDSTADSSGFWSVTALPPGTYTVTISAKGFAEWKETGVLLNQGDSRTIPNIHLKISSDVNAVTVISGADAEVPTDTAEISSTLNNELVDSAVLTGRNAAELIKMMPGVTFNNSGNAGSAYNSQTTGTNNGPAGNFSANGTQPYGSTAVILDGANLIDPGNAGTQIANINQDMTDSVKFLSASYGAEYAKGPAILQAFSKSGGQKYHGEAYVYARNTSVGYANDWFAKNQEAIAGQLNKLTPQYFYYVGGNVGGPISFKGFNRNKDKLFFWAGYEKMIQHPYNSAVQMNVPTADQIAGNFNNPGINPAIYNPATGTGVYSPAYTLPCATSGGWQGCGTADSPWGGYGNPGTAPNLKPYFDPNGAIVSGINPAANETPSAGNGWNNYTYSPSTPQDRWEATGKVTYAFNDNNKIWGSYTIQKETDNHPLSIWWAPEWSIPYPGKPLGTETAHVYLANYTHVFNASTTNEFVFSYAEFVNSNVLTDPGAVNPATLGLPNQTLFSGKSQDEIPGFTGGWAAGITEIGEQNFDGGIYGKNTFGKTAKAPAITDNFTKIVKTHSIKAGFYWDTSENLQSNSDGPPNPYSGLFDVENWGSSSTYNMTLDRLMGRNQAYTELSTVPVPDVLWHQWSIWAQDSWKATPKMTINVGLRLDHEGQWYDKLGGAQVWDPAIYDNSPNPPANTGLVWHKTLSSIPTSGWGSQVFLPDPRIGIAYDVFGTGKTVIRGGFGTYRYQVSENDSGTAMNGPLGSYSFNSNSQSNGFYGYGIAGGILSQGPGAAPYVLKVPSGLNQTGSGATVSADAINDNKVPYANTWSFGIAQAGPSHTVFQVSYVGSGSHNQLENGSGGGSHINDANPVAYGAFFLPDPKTGVLENPSPFCNGCTGSTAQDYRPLVNYGDVWVLGHGGWANYNSLQAAAQKQSGNLFLFSNFTFGKVLGTRDGGTSNGNGNGNTLDPFNLAADYGPLAYDHTKTFNVSFSYKLPSPIHNHLLVGEAINGWQVSGYTTYEDGNPFQANNPTMNESFTTPPVPAGNPAADGNCPASQIFTMPSGQQTCSISTSTYFGSNQYAQGLPLALTCDPRKGTKKGQYFNPGCFAVPLPPSLGVYGQQGPYIWPYIRNPHYFGSDLAVFKAFKVTESQRFEVRISATNWLNHPNAEFGEAGNSDQQLVFSGISTGSALSTNTNASTTGTPLDKTGYRWMQFAGKYYF
jgi:Carboxypeptidase regulatory-like domain/TonB-dependent Receptor Plug Domain